MTGTERDSDGSAAEPRKPADGDPPPQAGVLGNLPKKRPTVRSPRRREQPRPSEGSTEQAGAGPRSKESAPAAEKRAPRREPDRSHGTAGQEDSGHSPVADLEELARGGIAIAGGAASLGLRIAGRAAAALRDAVERR